MDLGKFTAATSRYPRHEKRPSQSAKRSRRRIIVPKGKPRRFYGQGVPGVDLSKLAGKLIVVEGADGSGRSTQIARLVQWLEGCGHATVQVGLKRSTLVSEELNQAQQGNILSHTTLQPFLRHGFCRPIGEHHFARLAGRVHGAGGPLHLHVDGARHGSRH